MRYWSILAAKLAAAAAVLFLVYCGLSAWYTPPPWIVKYRKQAFMHDLGWTTAMFFYNLLAQGILFLIFWDQRRRCRTCGRRLRMPVTHGSYGQMLLFGRPRTEYICPFGHGTLTQPELHISGREPAAWKAHDSDNIWEELYTLDKSDKR